ncbi:MAG: pentapeptide repeat-containing protein [Nocardioidaceae bacterium]
MRLRPGVLECLAGPGAGLVDLVGVTPDGLADLRGFWGRDGYRLEGVRLDRIDFSRADLTGWQFLDVSVHGCDFTGADLRDSRWFGTAVESSKFDRARLEGAALCTRSDEYPRQENSWVGCSFDRAKLKMTAFIGGIVQDCTFDDVRLAHVNFDGTRFVRTRFSGRLKEAIFDAPQDGDRFLDADGLDLREAQLDDTMILRYRSTGILLPRTTRFAVLESPAKQIPKAIKKLGKREDLIARQIRGILEDELHSAYRPGQHVIINLDDVAEPGFDEQFRDVLASVRARFLGPPTADR